MYHIFHVRVLAEDPHIVWIIEGFKALSRAIAVEKAQEALALLSDG